MSEHLPVIALGRLRAGDPHAVAAALRTACLETGFFYVSDHGVDEALLARLDAEARRFFARPLEDKLRLSMARGGRAWRGYFPVGGELTSGKPDLKEGMYLGQELPATHPRVQAGTLLHGANLFPEDRPALREAVLASLDALTVLGHQVMRGIAASLDLPVDHFERHLTADPLTLFRLFRYPADLAPHPETRWGVGEHTDYGLLTLLRQDDVGGLEVKGPRGWLEAPPLPGTFVCNIGDMLERLTGGLYRSTPHRVRNTSGRERLSFPFFFDPGWDARIERLPLPVPASASVSRWDGADVHAFEGTYGDYLGKKVAKVFPVLVEQLRD
jgi:isopenicillin N synthase-like dioxygenase